jgi:hypothetical protein
MTRRTPAIALAVLFLAAAFGLKLAETSGLIGAEMAQRTVMAIIGLVLAGYANLLPKQIGRRRPSLAAEARAQTARRVGGWSFTLAGLGYAAIWVVAPLSIAPTASMLVVGAGLAVTAGCALWACRGSGTPGVAPGA